MLKPKEISEELKVYGKELPAGDLNALLVFNASTCIEALERDLDIACLKVIAGAGDNQKLEAIIQQVRDALASDPETRYALKCLILKALEQSDANET